MSYLSSRPLPCVMSTFRKGGGSLLADRNVRFLEAGDRKLHRQFYWKCYAYPPFTIRNILLS